MSTDGGGLVNAILYFVVLVLAVQIGVGRLARPGGGEQRADPPRRAGLVAAAFIWLVVAVPSVLQIPFPGLLTHLERDPALVKDGQWWRVLTGLVVQDGGIGGTVFNLVILGVVGAVAGQLWGRALPLVFLLTHLSFAVPAVFLSSDIGAGNSGATLGLAASIVGWVVADPANPGGTGGGGVGGAGGVRRGEMARGVGILGAGIVLIVLLDAHGVPVVAGPFIGYAAATTTKHVADSEAR